MPSKYFSQSLPYRRLQRFANGIWDEERKTFYPFRMFSISTYASIPAKANMMYYVKSATISGQNSGDHAAAANYISIVVGGTSCLIRLILCQTVAAANVNANATVSPEIEVLADVNTAVSAVIGATSGHINIIYAMIPADPAGGPVVIE